MKHSRSIWIWAFALAGIFVLLMPIAASAQSCALCYTQAASSGSRMIQALKSGIIILIAPPTLMSLGVIFVCYRRHNKTRDDIAEPDREWKNDQDDSSADLPTNKW
jgi:cbb3-type cytochrome oxidase subunit 3